MIEWRAWRSQRRVAMPMTRMRSVPPTRRKIAAWSSALVVSMAEREEEGCEMTGVPCTEEG